MLDNPAVSNDRQHDQPDRLTLLLVGTGLVLAFALGLQKWFLATRVADLVQDFGVEVPWLARVIILSPRILALPLVFFAVIGAAAGKLSRTAGLVVVVGLLAANIVMLAVMAQIHYRLSEAIS